jgi:DNA-binding response OmpR family regulator
MTLQSLDILYVDDEPDLREIVTAALEMDLGFHVRTCGDAASAWAAIEVKMPDLIILDVMMPDIDGPALFVLLKANIRTTEVPVIFMTAKVLKPELAKLADLRPAGIVQKPFNPRTLAAEIRRMCNAVQPSDSDSDISLEPLLDRMRARFKSEAASVGQRLKDGLSLPAENPHSARRIAHSVAGTAGTIGYMDIADLAGQIDAAPPDEAVDEKLVQLAARLMEIATTL